MMRLDTIKNLFVALLSVCVVLAIAEFAIGFLILIRDVGPSFSEYHPIFGQHLKANFSAVRRTPEFTMKLSTNSFGFRGPKLGVLPKGPILFLGDSFTMGYGVDDGEEFPALVTARLRATAGPDPIPAVNAGIGDSGNGRWVKLLRHMGEAMQPRLVVMQMLDNDFEDNIAEGLFELDQAGVLKELPVPRPGFARTVQALIDAVPGLASTNLVGLLRQVRLTMHPTQATETSIAMGPRELAPHESLTIAIVEEVILFSREKGWPMLGLLVGLEKPRHDAVAKVFAKHGVDIVILPGKRERPDLYFKIDGHWNRAGHIAAADRILKELCRNGIVAC